MATYDLRDWGVRPDRDAAARVAALCVLCAALLPGCAGPQIVGGDLAVCYPHEGPQLHVACEIVHDGNKLAVHNLRFRVREGRHGTFRSLAATWDGYCQQGRWLTMEEYGGGVTTIHDPKWALNGAWGFVWERAWGRAMILAVSYRVEDEGSLVLRYLLRGSDGEHCKFHDVTLPLASAEPCTHFVQFGLDAPP